MNVSGQDINQTLEYRSATAIVRLLPTGLLLVFLGLVIFALVDLDREPWTFIGIVLCWVVGGALAGFALWRRMNPGKPLFTLSPAGIHYRIPMVKEILIPWQEIQGVDTIDVEAGYWSILWSTQFRIPRYNTWVARDVTVILLPKPFYDQRIFVDSFFCEAPAGRPTSFPKARWSRWRCTTNSFRSSRGRSAKRSKRAGSHFATGPPRTGVDERTRRDGGRAIRTLQRARRLAPRRRQASWRWEITRKPCRGGRPQRSLSR